MIYSAADVDASRTSAEAANVRAQLKARLVELDTEFKGQTFDDNAREEFAALEDLIARAANRESEFKMREQRVHDLASEPDSVITIGRDMGPTRSRAKSLLPDDLHDVTEYRVRTNGDPERMKALMVDGAKKVVDAATFPHERADEAKTKARLHRLLDRIDEPEELARRILATSAPIYAPAFFRALATEGRGLTPEMRAGIAVVGTTTAGGYAVPYTLDPSLILTTDGQLNPVRTIARVEQIMGNTWKGLTSAGITVTRGAEAAAITPSDVTFGQPSYTVQAVKAEIQFSIEADEDWPSLQSEMARVLQDAKDAEEAEQFINGTGLTVFPGGLVETLDATYHVGTGGDGLSIDDPGRLVGRLGDRWEPRARFLGNRAVFLELERLARADGFNEPPIAAGQQPALLGYPKHYASGMEDDFTTNGGEILLFGDFSQYLVLDRVGMSIEVDPHVRDGNGKWTGQRALLAHWRNTAGYLVESAFRLLVVGTVSS